MKLELIPSLGEADEFAFDGKTVIVIDTLRATSNIVTALTSGVRAIVPAATREEAQTLWQPGDMRGGERGAIPIPGFELGNSPSEYERPDLLGRRIILTTTNGTRAIAAAASAKRLLAASLLNARASAEAIASVGGDTVILCAGTRNLFCAEDGLAAGAVLAELLGKMQTGPHALHDCDMDDYCRVMLGYFAAHRDNLAAELYRSDSGRRLTKLGFSKDVAFCAQLNRYCTVPCFVNGELVSRSSDLSPID
ncbi:2-phosphosulfolactate phosphatase [Gorillibacterium timonense]|uniref:2-phosphosulfolactate phosphatase n=1 Tax=Gorillibacterium timonense TaxID=1689269 RepID=UPI00071CE0F3|nr:2-phosphosulfolactate phosphatase [Gorillibacterium timonense]